MPNLGAPCKTSVQCFPSLKLSNTVLSEHVSMDKQQQATLADYKRKGVEKR